MTAAQRVFGAAVVLVALSIVSVCAGVLVLAGVGWALVAAGSLTGPAAVSAAVVLLRDGDKPG